jgi:hypothetical protein
LHPGVYLAGEAAAPTMLSTVTANAMGSNRVVKALLLLWVIMTVSSLRRVNMIAAGHI